eukprot:3192109-Rhodomonas_salina.2
MALTAWMGGLGDTGGSEGEQAAPPGGAGLVSVSCAACAIEYRNHCCTSSVSCAACAIEHKMTAAAPRVPRQTCCLSRGSDSLGGEAGDGLTLASQDPGQQLASLRAARLTQHRGVRVPVRPVLVEGQVGHHHQTVDVNETQQARPSETDVVSHPQRDNRLKQLRDDLLGLRHDTSSDDQFLRLQPPASRGVEQREGALERGHEVDLAHAHLRRRVATQASRGLDAEFERLHVPSGVHSVAEELIQVLHHVVLEQDVVGVGAGAEQVVQRIHDRMHREAHVLPAPVVERQA